MIKYTGTNYFKNKIINGNFDIWQRNTSQTSSGYGSDYKWANSNIGSTKVHSRQTFTLGQTDVPNNPKYYSRTVVTSVAGAGNYVIKQQRIENVKTLAGKIATLSFYAKADANKNITVSFSQVFGTGGSPSEGLSINITTCSLTTSWQKFTIIIVFPSIVDKTLGTDGNDYLRLNFWFDAGSNYINSTNSLGQQSGTFDIAQVQLEEGSTATEFEDRPLSIEEMLCYRYYQTIRCSNISYATGASQIFGGCENFPVRMRNTPTGSLLSGATMINAAGFGYNPVSTFTKFWASSSGTGKIEYVQGIAFDAEL